MDDTAIKSKGLTAAVVISYWFKAIGLLSFSGEMLFGMINSETTIF